MSMRVKDMCKYDEAFTEQEMLEETGSCRKCRMDCPNAGRTRDWEWVKIKVRPRDKEIIERACGYGSLANLAQWLVEDLAESLRGDTNELIQEI